jgi:hypothetical protein
VRELKGESLGPTNQIEPKRPLVGWSDGAPFSDSEGKAISFLSFFSFARKEGNKKGSPQTKPPS